MAECEIAAALAREGDIAGAWRLPAAWIKGMVASSPTASATRPWPRSLRSPSSRRGPATRLRRKPRSGSRSQSPRSRTDATTAFSTSASEGSSTRSAKSATWQAPRQPPTSSRRAASREPSLWQASRAQAKSSDIAAARATLREAQSLAREVGPIPNRINDDPVANADRAFREVVLAQAETGDVPGALETIGSRGSDDWKSEVLAGVVDIQVRRGDFAARLSRRVPSPGPILQAKPVTRSPRARHVQATPRRAGVGLPPGIARSEGLRRYRHRRRGRLASGRRAKGRTSQAVTASPQVFRAKPGNSSGLSLLLCGRRGKWVSASASSACGRRGQWVSASVGQSGENRFGRSDQRANTCLRLANNS